MQYRWYNYLLFLSSIVLDTVSKLIVQNPLFSWLHEYTIIYLIFVQLLDP